MNKENPPKNLNWTMVTTRGGQWIGSGRIMVNTFTKRAGHDRPINYLGLVGLFTKINGSAGWVMDDQLLNRFKIE